VSSALDKKFSIGDEDEDEDELGYGLNDEASPTPPSNARDSKGHRHANSGVEIQIGQ